jgi:hypothetical protein
LGVVAAIYRLTLSSIVQRLLPLSLPWRILATAGLTALPGFLMGIPFPSALRLAREHLGAGIPFLWGVNSTFSVLGSTLAVGIAVMWGFGWAMIAGACHYLALGVLVGYLRAVGGSVVQPT